MTHTAALPVAQPAPPGLWVIHCDGSAIPNPGRMGLGATLLAPDGQQHTLSHTSSLVGCNNEAELRALMAALRQAHALGARAIAVRSDSSLLIEQLRPPQPGQRPALSAGVGAHLQPGDEQAAISLPSQGQFGCADLEAVEMRLQAQQG